MTESEDKAPRISIPVRTPRLRESQESPSPLPERPLAPAGEEAKRQYEEQGRRDQLADEAVEAAKEVVERLQAVAKAARGGQGENEDHSESEKVKLTVNLSHKDMATLRRIAAKREISLTDAIRRAIAMEEFIDEIDREGGKLLVEQSDRSMRQLVLR